jgi:hypothetical protein
LTKFNTGEQLKSPEKIKPKDFSVGAKKSHQSKDQVQIDEGKKASQMLLVSHLNDFLKKFPSGNFLQWLRNFHEEYDDAWFRANLHRLETVFKPVWDQSNHTVANKNNDLFFLD